VLDPTTQGRPTRISIRSTSASTCTISPRWSPSSGSPTRSSGTKRRCGGPLCVVEGGVARTDLERILDEVSGQVETTWANLDLVGGRVEVGVNVVDPDVQAALDRQYGEGAVVLYGHLEPVE
jgi:hypothetical protein